MKFWTRKRAELEEKVRFFVKECDRLHADRSSLMDELANRRGDWMQAMRDLDDARAEIGKLREQAAAGRSRANALPESFLDYFERQTDQDTDTAELRASYRQTFSSPHGRQVLADLARFCHALGPTLAQGPGGVTDLGLTGFQEGMRRVFLRCWFHSHAEPESAAEEGEE